MLKIRSPSQVQLLLRGVGQKHSRAISLGALISLLVFSCSSRPFIVHRTRGTMNQLTAALRLPKHSYTSLIQIKVQKEKGHREDVLFFLAPQTGLEPVTPRLTAACSTD